MMIGKFKSESSVACLLLSIPDDVFAVISRSLSPSDICNLSLCCKCLCSLVDSEKIWIVQCEIVKVLPLSKIVQWRIGISSYKALCRFLVEVTKPLVGVWVHQNPELGNVVYVMPGFLSVVGCRIIPQKVGPLWIQEGGVLWSPVFEIICGFDGSSKFFLHGRDGEGNCLYPGFVTGIDKSCNVLLLEVEPRREKSLCNEIEREASRKVPFCKLRYSEKKKLLDIVTGLVGVDVLEPISGTLFPSSKDDEAMLLERRTMLLKMHKFGGNWNHMKLEEDELCYNPMQVDIKKMWKKLRYDNSGMDDDDDDDQIQVIKPKKSFSRSIRNGIKKHLLGSSSYSKDKPLKTEKIRSNLQHFLSSGDTFGISLKACNTEISSYQVWPTITRNFLALYELPIQNQEYGGLWGATFGWSPERCVDDKLGEAFYLLMLTYQESEEESSERLLIGTKILEGNRYMMRPNGSAMFVVKIDTHSLETFPLDTYGRDLGDSYMGEGIEQGYGFRDPLSTPGSLFVISDDLLAFVWQETKDVFTLQRLNLEEILKKGLGLCVPPLPPRRNFHYRSRARTNVFVKPSLSSYSSSSEYESNVCWY